jgi:hypothetical protein
MHVHWKCLPCLVECLQVRQEPTQIKHLSGALLYGWHLPDRKHLTRLEMLFRENTLAYY